MGTQIKKTLFKWARRIAHKACARLSGQRSAPAPARDLAVDEGVLQCEIAYNRFGGYCVPRSSRHRPAASRVLAQDVYEPQTIDFMVSHCGNGDVVHAGTYFGDFLPALSKALAPGARLWAFEPNPENYRCARITCEINDAANVLLTNAGLGANQDQMLLLTTEDNGEPLGGGSRIVAAAPDMGQHVESIRIVAIDDMIDAERKVSIIQLDVEGHERQALTGALRTIARCRPILILEVLPGTGLTESDWFADNILSLGYRKIGDAHGNAIFACGAVREPGP